MRRYNGRMVFLALAFVGLVIGAGVAIVKWILDPLEVASRQHRRPTQFTIADFLCLFFLLQLPVAAIHALPDGIPRDVKAIFDCVAWIICGLLWATCVKKLANCGIERPRHRLIFLAVVLPVSFFGTMAFVFSGIICGACFLDTAGGAIWGLVLLFVELALLVVFRLSGNFVRRMVTAAEPKPLDAEDQTATLMRSP
jgi:hypothetical protein